MTPEDIDQMTDDDRPPGVGTRLAQLGRMSDSHHGFINTPIYRGSTVLFDSLDDLDGMRARYVYGTAGGSAGNHYVQGQN